jgi:hypothetical protein
LALCRARARKAHSFCAGGEGVILHSILCRSKNGASHRENVDTSPPNGNGGAPHSCFHVYAG